MVELVQVALAGEQRLRREHLAEEAPDRPDIHRPAHASGEYSSMSSKPLHSGAYCSRIRSERSHFHFISIKWSLRGRVAHSLTLFSLCFASGSATCSLVTCESCRWDCIGQMAGVEQRALGERLARPSSEAEETTRGISSSAGRRRGGARCASKRFGLRAELHESAQPNAQVNASREPRERE